MVPIPVGFHVTIVSSLEALHHSLVVGVSGIVDEPVGRSAINPRFVRVRFTTSSAIIALDVDRTALNVTDDRWPSYLADLRGARETALRDHVRKATVFTTPRGGFVELVVEYSNNRPTDRWNSKSSAREVLADLERRGLLEEVKANQRGNQT